MDWVHRLSRDEMTDWVASRSYVITLPDERRRSLLGQVRDLLGTTQRWPAATRSR